MFEQMFYRCPNCGTEIRQTVTDGQALQCDSCRRRYSTMVDKASKKAGLIPIRVREIPEPLHLPKGSVRASATLLLSGACWLLMIQAQDVPGYLLSLLLAVIGYYFGFRYKAKTSESRIFDATARHRAPLYLPSGVIRGVLVVGFLIAGVFLCKSGKLEDLKYLEFAVILSGLILGYFFGKMMNPIRESNFYVLVNHLKGVALLGCAISLAGLLVTGAHTNHPHAGLAFATVVSFYFGSRS